MKYGVLTYANMRGIREIDRIVELCKRDLAFIWLTQGEQPKRDAFYGFINDKLTGEILDDLNYQLLRRLKKEGYITLETLFVDGTKMEANANRYTFVWRGTLNYHLARLLDTIDSLYHRYNGFLKENRYDENTDWGMLRCLSSMAWIKYVISSKRTGNENLQNTRNFQITA